MRQATIGREGYFFDVRDYDLRLSYTKLVCMIRWLVFLGGRDRCLRPSVEQAYCLSDSLWGLSNLVTDIPASLPDISVSLRQLASCHRAVATDEIRDKNGKLRHSRFAH